VCNEILTVSTWTQEETNTHKKNIIWKYSEHTRNKFYRWLSIHGTNFIAGWACTERISSLAEHMWKQFYRTLSIGGNNFIAHWAYAEQILAYAQCAMKFQQFRHGHKRKPIPIKKTSFKIFWAYAEQILSLAEHTRNKFHRWLSMRGTNFIAGWAYAERISLLSLVEHTRKCLKVEYLDRIEYNFQKSCVTGPWEHKVSVSAKKV
jgi:hypothetical protein